MKNFEFKSQICTTKPQSEALLALGLKKETADCRHWTYIKDSKGNPIPKRNQKWFTRIGADESAQVCGFMDATFIPAWSLHRLIETIDYPSNIDAIKELLAAKTMFNNRLYDRVISIIEYLISNNNFNKDYLENEIK